MLTLTLVRSPLPMPDGRAGAWIGFQGMTTLPEATRSARRSGDTRSSLATFRNWGEKVPFLAFSICVMISFPRAKIQYR